VKKFVGRPFFCPSDAARPAIEGFAEIHLNNALRFSHKSRTKWAFFDFGGSLTKAQKTPYARSLMSGFIPANTAS
jgi:hypothetical protein